jgi:sulfatase modifying factor 1
MDKLIPLMSVKQGLPVPPPAALRIARTSLKEKGILTMRKLTAIILLTSIIVVNGACSLNTAPPKEKENHMVFVKGGTFINRTSNFYTQNITIPDFYISAYEITQKEWVEVMGYNPSAFQGDDLPVEMVSWYDAIEYCNRRSLLEGLEPYYTINKEQQDPENKSEYDPIKWTVTINEGANGYRLPTEAEWEYAASGGQLSSGNIYSGSNQADEVAWHFRNAGDEYLAGDWSWPMIENNNNRPHPVGQKKPNELGLYDMSGNVREWCWDWYESENEPKGLYRVVKGGGWIGDVVNTEISFRGKFEASGYGPDQGFRVVRDA